MRRSWVKWVGLVISVCGAILGAVLFVLGGMVVHNALAAGTHAQPAPEPELIGFLLLCGFFGLVCGVIPGALILVAYRASKRPA
jgi:hypothetical protein